LSKSLHSWPGNNLNSTIFFWQKKHCVPDWSDIQAQTFSFLKRSSIETLSTIIIKFSSILNLTRACTASHEIKFNSTKLFPKYKWEREKHTYSTFLKRILTWHFAALTTISIRALAREWCSIFWTISTVHAWIRGTQRT
jgi:hypothetical protein